jgi:hypothetical protein
MVGGGDQIPVESQRALILFHILGCGTAQENTEVLDCVRRTSKAPYDDLEEASNGVCIGLQAKTSGTTSGSGLKRKNRDEDSIGQAFLEGANRLADAISAPQSSPSTLSGNELGSASILETSRLIEEYSRLLILVEKAESGAADTDYIQMLRNQLKLSKERIKISQKREEERNISGSW